MEEKDEPKTEHKEDNKNLEKPTKEEIKPEKLSKEEIKRKKKEEKEAKKREEKARKEEEKRLKKEQKAKEKELRKSLNQPIKPSKNSAHLRLKSSVQILPSNINNFDYITPELPDSFFEDLLLKEMELSEDFTIEKLSGLIKLYSQAMEHYLQTDPPKAKEYQVRMEYLLTNKDTLKQLKKESENLTARNISNRNTQNQILDVNAEKKSKSSSIANIKKSIELQTDNLAFDDIMDKVSEVIGGSNAKGDLQTTKSLIENDLEKQNKSWKEKLKHKKKGMLRGSMAFLTHRRIKSDLMKSKITLGSTSSTDEKINLAGKKLEKMKVVFNDDLYEEVKEIKEENEPEGSDKENDEKKDKDKNEGGEKNEKNEKSDKNEKKEEILNLENLNIVNSGDGEEEKDKINIFDKIEEVEEKEINEEKEDKKDKDKDDKDNKKENIEPRPRRKSIVDKDVTRNVEIDEKILTSVNQKMDLLLKLIEDIEKNKLNEDEDEVDENIQDNKDNTDNNKINDIENNNKIIEEKKDIISSGLQTGAMHVPAKFQGTYYQVENIMQSYMDEFNHFYYKDIFEQFASHLKEIYDDKYKKYIDVSVEYHNQIKQNEHILENNDNLSEEKKAEIQQIIDSLKDEQQNQIAKIEDEFNRLIVSKVNEFKINSFKNNSGIQLLEEQLKLDIYSIINESFY